MVQKAKNTLNDLDAKSWVKSTKSWFVINPRSRSREQLSHPAKYPEELVHRFVTYFTKQDGWVLDPFAGVGSTLVACRESGRNAVGIELSNEFVEIGKRALQGVSGNGLQLLIQGDSLNSDRLISNHFGEERPVFDYVVTSPPYWNMLRKSRGGNRSVHKVREEEGLKQYYSESERDLGNISSYGEYIDGVGRVMSGLKTLLSEKAYLTVVVQNMRDVGVDIIVDCCPFCHMQFDLGQIEVNEFYKDMIGEPFNIPVIYLTQLLGLSYGIDPNFLGLVKDDKIQGVSPFIPIKPFVNIVKDQLI